MTRKSFTAILLSAVFAQSMFLSSCSTDIELLEEYKPITVVYGLLNTQEDTQFIKINKAFLGEGNALLMAQQSDSVNYQPGELDVKLQKVGDANFIQCFEYTGIAKEDGIFSNPYQLLYYSNVVLDPNATYKLIINRHTDAATITASSPVVKDITIQQPSSPTAQLNLASQASYFIRWQSGANGKIFNVVMRFPYREYTLSPADTQLKSVEWNLGNVVAANINGNESMALEIGGENFMRFLQTTIPYDANKIRAFNDTDKVELIFSAGAEDLYTYIQVNSPSIGLIQEKPSYTNISNGVGIFSSRWKKSYFNRLNQPTRDSLRGGRFTGNLFN